MITHIVDSHLRTWAPVRSCSCTIHTSVRSANCAHSQLLYPINDCAN